MIPDFNEKGDLPVGIYSATIAEIHERFGKSSGQRQIIVQRLERIHRLACATGCVARMILFGSFITTKEEPGDVDLAMIMDDAFDPDQLTGETKLLFDHGAAQAYFGASIFWLRRFAIFGDPQAFVEDWQIKRDRQRRGILDIVLEAT